MRSRISRSVGRRTEASLKLQYWLNEEVDVEQVFMTYYHTPISTKKNWHFSIIHGRIASRQSVQSKWLVTKHQPKELQQQLLFCFRERWRIDNHIKFREEPVYRSVIITPFQTPLFKAHYHPGGLGWVGPSSETAGQLKSGRCSSFLWGWGEWSTVSLAPRYNANDS